MCSREFIKIGAAAIGASVESAIEIPIYVGLFLTVNNYKMNHELARNFFPFQKFSRQSWGV